MKPSIDAIRKLIKNRLYATHEQEVDTNMWMVPYVNLMTILMIFFLILYAFTNLNKKVYEKAIMDIKVDVVSREKQAKKMRELESIKKFEHFIWDNNIEKFVEMEMDSQKIVITLKEPILFNKGEAEIKDAANPALREIAGFIGVVGGRVRVGGHTDNIPIKSEKYNSNWELAAARAYSIVNHFISREKLSPEMFAILSYADNRPVASNETAEGRGKNRRIEISIDRRLKS